MKYTVKKNFRVVIEPRRLGDYGCVIVSDTFGGASQKQIERDYQSRCEQIVEEARRHVDCIGGINIEYDDVDLCSHCGNTWEEDSTGMPQCCGRAIDEWENAGEESK